MACRKYRQGPPGDSTLTGPAGADGVDGIDGIDGTDGLNGKDGRDGRDGVDGLNGRDGTNGTQGPIGLPGPGSAITWPDDTARTTTIPLSVGQLSVQLSDNTLWVADSLVVGDWSLIPWIPRTTPDSAGRAASTPIRLNEFLLQVDSGVLYYGTALSAGSWTAVNSSVVITPPTTVWTIPVVIPEETIPANGTPPVLIPAGAASVKFNATSARLTLNQPGGVNSVLTVQVHLPDSGRNLTTANIVIPAGETTVLIASGSLTPTIVGTLDPITHIWSDGIASGERLVVEIVGNGAPIPAAATTGGSAVVTIPAGSLVKTLPGTAIIPAGGNQTVVLSINQAGTLRTSHPAAATSGSIVVTAQERMFVRGVFGLSLVVDNVTVPISALDATLIRAGDDVVGETVAPGTKVVSVNPAGPSLVISNPLLGDTAQLGFTHPDRPKVIHFTAISGTLFGDTVIPVPVDLTLVAFLDDMAKGTGIPAGANLSGGVNPTTLDLSIAITAPITEMTITPPEKTINASATAFLGTSITFNDNRVIGYMVNGPGVPPDSFVSAYNSGTSTITVTKAWGQTLAGDVVTFTRDRKGVTCGITNNSTAVNLPTTAANTVISVGDLVESSTGVGIQAGTYVVSMAGSGIVLSKQAKLTATALLIFTPQPPASGLTLTMAGHWSP